jgi:multidrug efflux system membrane fusion protein
LERNDVHTKTSTAILSLALATAACRTAEPIPQAPQAVQARRVESDSAADRGALRYSAIIMPDAQVTLSFRIPGYVVALKQVRGDDGRMRDFAEGDEVGNGTVLVRIRASEYEDKVRQATSQASATEAVAQKATLDFERATRLYDGQSMTKPDLDAARAQYDSARSELQAAHAATSEAEVALRDTSLVAPFAGEIVKKTVELGTFVGPGIPVFAVANTDSVKITIGVPDTTVRSIKLGQPVDVTVDAIPDHTFRARISRIASAADAKTRNFEVEVAVPNRDHMLKVGMVGSLQLALDGAETHQTALRVPLSSIVQSDDGTYAVFVVAASPDGGTVARLRPVEIGRVVGTDISIVHGLVDSEDIITTGANLVKDGQRVEVVK